jgi:AraC-like DNA-binding protein
MRDNGCLETAGTAAPVSPFVIFDTVSVPESERFGLWREHVANTVASHDFDPLEDRPFHARMEMLSVGGLKVIRSNSNTGSWTRRSDHLADGRGHVALYMSGSGAFRVVQGNLDIVQGPHHFALVDHSKPSAYFQDTSEGDCGFVLSDELLHRVSGQVGKRPSPAAGAPTDGIWLLRSYLDAIFARKAGIANPMLQQRIGDHLLDLITLGLGASRDAVYVAQNRGLKAARVQAILAAIERSFSEPDISSKGVAAHLHISQRYLHELLEERGCTFTQLILERRLDKARAMLGDRGFDHLRIGQIAYECGFNDLSYFNRRFRARFGDTPGGVRGT